MFNAATHYQLDYPDLALILALVRGGSLARASALLKTMLQYGLHLGQQAEMVTDSLRALFLEACGYETKVFEFISLEQIGRAHV